MNMPLPDHGPLPFNNLLPADPERRRAEEEAVLRAVRSGCYILGPEVDAFEKEYALFCGSPHAVGCASGLDAIWLMLRAALENGLLRPGDEVLVPANTYIATMLGIVQAGLTPVPVEPDPATCLMPAVNIERALTPRTRAVMLVHLFGLCAWSAEIESLSLRHNLLLFEDNAQAHGCRAGGSRTGSFGLAAAHSFYPTKNLGAWGDAGAVTTSSPELAATVRTLRNYGSDSKGSFPLAGRNSRLDEIQAALLRTRLRFLDADNCRRRELASLYLRTLDTRKVTWPLQPPEGQNVFHLFPVFTPHRDSLSRHLRLNGIGTQIHYPVAPHRQGALPSLRNLNLPVTERLHATELSLPLHPSMRSADVERVVAAIDRWNP